MDEQAFRMQVVEDLATIKSDVAHVKTQCPEREKRIRALEDWRLSVTARVVAVSAFVALVVGVAWQVVRVAL